MFMLDRLLFASIFLSVLGAGLIGGLFFAFSSFVMTALGRVTPATGIVAMQAINIAVLNPVFFAVFFGTAALCLLLALAVLLGAAGLGASYLLAGSVLYLGGGIVVTIACNVPLNNALAAVEPDSAEGTTLWRRYLSGWTAWNHVRTAACLAASAAFVVALCVRVDGAAAG
jgi:uncharacterized membrane protein